MIFNLANVSFTDDEWIYILAVILKGWTEVPLSQLYGYNKDNVKFFDGIIGSLLRQTEELQVDYPDALDQRFVNSWKYQGKLYRVLHPSMIEDENSIDGYSSALPQVEYHEMITHWTTDFTFEALLYKLSADTKYIILEADTKEHFAFDVNGFRAEYGFEERFTQKEQEIIFPMYKECIQEHCMTVNEFIEMKTKSCKMNF